MAKASDLLVRNISGSWLNRHLIELDSQTAIKQVPGDDRVRQFTGSDRKEPPTETRRFRFWYLDRNPIRPRLLHIQFVDIPSLRIWRGAFRRPLDSRFPRSNETPTSSYFESDDPASPLIGPNAQIQAGSRIGPPIA